MSQETVDLILAVVAVPIATAVINLMVDWAKARDSALGQAVGAVGTDMIALFRVLFARRGGK